MKLFATLAAAAALTAVASSANAAGEIIAPVSGVIDAGGPGFGTLTETFNQVGMSAGYNAGVTNFDSYIASNPIHSPFVGFEWFSNQGATSAVVTYDFGALVTIDRLALWNEESSGIGLLDLLGSTDGVSFSAFAAGLTPTDHPAVNIVPYFADVFSFTATSLRYVRFNMSGCPQPLADYSACAIGEVAFRTADTDVPAPAALALFGLGAAVLFGARRAR